MITLFVATTLASLVFGTYYAYNYHKLSSKYADLMVKHQTVVAYAEKHAAESKSHKTPVKAGTKRTRKTV